MRWFFVLCALLVASVSVGHAEQVRVLDGDTLLITGERVRLVGFDAPESRQQCLSAQGAVYPCGRKATQFLKDLITGKSLTCESQGTDKYGRTLARCWIGRRPLGSHMVEAGQAVVWPWGEAFYLAEQETARTAGAGLWAGTFQMPWDWRRSQ